MFSLRHVTLTVAALIASSAYAAPQLKSKLFSLDSLGYSTTYAADFCGNGQLAGTTLTPDWQVAGFLTNRKGELTIYSVPGSTYTDVFGCYESRLMGRTVVNGVMSGFYQDEAGNVQLVAPKGSVYPTVEGMNAAGTVVGWYMPQDKDNVRASGFIIQNGVFTRFDLNGRPDTRLMGILDDGTLYGTYMDGIPLRATGFIIRQGVQTDLRIKGSYDTVVSGMNSAGQVVGYYQEAIGEPYQGFIWAQGNYYKYSFSAEGGSTYPKGIDAKGNVVGYISNPDYSQTGFVARPSRSAR